MAAEVFNQVRSASADIRTTTRNDLRRKALAAQIFEFIKEHASVEKPIAESILADLLAINKGSLCVL